MTVLATPQFTGICPRPVENDICFAFTTDEYKLTNGLATEVFIGLDSTFINNVNGEIYYMLGGTFEVQSGTTSAWTFDGTTGSLAMNAANFYEMITLNFLFKGVQVEFIELIPGSLYAIRLENCEVGATPSWTFDFTGMTNPPFNVNETVTGVDATFVDGYKIVYQLLCNDGPCYTSVCPEQAVTPFVDSAGDVGDMLVDFHHELSPQVYTTLPDNTAPLMVQDLTILKEFIIQFGSLESFGDCETRYNECYRSDPFKVINAAIQDTSSSGFAPYCMDTTSFLLPILFMNSRPKISKITDSSYQWLWFYGNIFELASLTVVPVSVTYVLLREYFLNGASLGATNTTVSTNDGVFIVPVGTENPIGAVPASYDKYTVKIIASIDYGMAGIVVIDLTETRTYIVECSDCVDTELYFLSEPGGYDTINFENRADASIVVAQNEICTDVICATPLAGYLNEGRQQVNTEAYERITLTTREYQKTSERLQFFVQFKKSESRYIRIRDRSGNVAFRRFLVDPGSVRIFEKDAKILLTVSGRFGSNRKQQSYG